MSNDAEFQGLSEDIKLLFGTAMHSIAKVKILKNFYSCLSMIFLIYGKNVPTKCILESSVVMSFVEKAFLHLLKRLRALGDKQL